MNWVSIAWSLAEAAWSAPTVAHETADVLAARGPLAALDYLCAHSPVPPAVAVEARTLATGALTALHVATGAAVACVDALTAARPLVARAAVLVDQGIGVAIDAGLWCGVMHARVAGWLEG